MWAVYEATAETRSILSILLNHVQDQELKELIEHFMADVLEPQVEKVGQKLLKEGLELPVATPDKPKAQREQIPMGARFDDEQIANMVVVKVQGLLIFCSEGIYRSLRDDVASLHYTYQGHLLAQGVSLKTLMIEKGWLRVPPVYPPSADANA